MLRGQHLGPDLPSLLYKAVNILYKLVHINEFEILFVLIFFIISFLLSKLLVSVPVLIMYGGLLFSLFQIQ
jgi:hypothetical protein